MMHIDTHKAFTKLVEAGLKKEAAEGIIGVIEESRQSGLDNLATKQDLSEVKSELKQDIADVRLEIANVRTELKEEIANVRTELVKEIGIVREGVFEAKLTAAKFHADLKEDNADLKGKFGTMQWMMGFLLAMCSAIILKLFW